nr:hypothetical protein [Tanacetum cinerariifolium]
MVAILKKSDAAQGFEIQLWSSARVTSLGVICLPNDEIFAGLARMGYEKPSTKLTFYKAFFSTQWKFFIHTILHSLSVKRTSWNEFSSAMASALICLSSGQRVGKGFSGLETPLFENMLAIRAVDAEEEVQANSDAAQGFRIQLWSSARVTSLGQRFYFSKYIFESLVRNVNSTSKFYMYPRVRKGFSGVDTPLFENMLTVRAVDAEEEVQKVGTSQRVESSEDVENVFNQGRISVDMETNEGIKLEVDQEKDAEIEGRQADTQAEIYNIDLDHSSKVAAASAPIPAAKPKVLKIAATAPTVSTRRRKGVVIRDPEEELHTDTPAKTPTVKDKGKGILIEDPKPMKKKDQIEMDAEYAKKLQEELEKKHEEAYKQIDWNAAFDHTREEMEKEDEEIIKSINETPAQKAAKRRKLSEEAQEADDLRGRLDIVQDKDDDVFVEAIPLARKVPVVDYQVVVIDNKPRYKIIRADDIHQLYISFTTLLKNFDREDLETLWRIVKGRFSTKKPTNFSDEYLLLILKTMFGELDKQDAI